jgi:hypothetical protein
MSLFNGQPLDKAIDQIAYDEVRDLNDDPAFRLQQDQFRDLAGFLHRGPRATRHKATARRKRGRFRLRSASGGRRRGFQILLPVKSETNPAALAIDHKNKTSRPLTLIAMALLAAFADSGDGRPLREVVGNLTGSAQGAAGN